MLGLEIEAAGIKDDQLGGGTKGATQAAQGSEKAPVKTGKE
jgi:hypothetical protein